MINDVVFEINKVLGGFSNEEKLFGIAETILRRSGSVEEQMPAIVLPDGEMVYVGVDDIYSLMVYHKLNSITASLLSNGAGNRPGDLRNVFNMSSFIYWDMNKVPLDIGYMLMLMQSRMPMGFMFKKEGVKRVLVSTANIFTNSYQIYRQEYGDAAKSFPANKRIIQMNYIIEINFNPECFRQCPECSDKK